MRRIIIFSILIMAIISCNKEEIQIINKQQQTVVSGVLKNINDYPNTKILHLQKNGQVNQSRRDVKLESQIDKAGNFNFDFKLDSKTDFYLKPFEHIYLYVEPGDKIFVEIDLSKQNGIVFSGDRVKENEVLNLYYRKYYFDDRRREERELISTLNPQEYYNYRDSIALENIIALNKFSIEQNLSVSLKSMLLAEILNRKHHKLINFGLVNNTRGRFDKEKNKDFFYFLREKLLEDINSMQNHSSFNKYVDLYRYYFHNINNSFELIDAHNNSNVTDIYKNQIIENEMEEKLKDILFYREAKYLLESYEIDEFELHKEFFYSHIKSEQLLSEIKLHYEKLNLQGIDITPLSNYSLEDDDILKSIKTSYNGEVALINVWSPNCYPSVEDMMKTKEYLDSKDYSGGVKYINICTGKDEEECKRLIQENDFPGEHMYLENRAKIQSRFNSISIPLQIIIDKQGNVIRKGSNHRPYRPTTQKVLNKLQEEIKG